MTECTVKPAALVVLIRNNSLRSADCPRRCLFVCNRFFFKEKKKQGKKNLPTFESVLILAAASVFKDLVTGGKFKGS